MVRIIYNRIGILDILLFVIIISLFVMVLTRIFGNSATEIQIINDLKSLLEHKR